MYDQQDLLRLAKRSHNTKRIYLLVDPLQGKHIPVSPAPALSMMNALGSKLFTSAPDADLVIGFAETATAIAAEAAACQGDACALIDTTRESAFLAGHSVLRFHEEHSHAVEQNLCLDRIASAIEKANTVALVDDEFSTGKTLVNFIRELRHTFPVLKSKRIIACSVISRLSDEQKRLFAEDNIQTVSLLNLPFSDYSRSVEQYAIEDAAAPPDEAGSSETVFFGFTSPGEARHGVNAAGYRSGCERAAGEIADRLRREPEYRRLIVLGTEEYMYPGLIAAARIESQMPESKVLFHATTRSPIGICGDADYPIKNGYRVHSFYSDDRETFLYNITPCDAVLVVTDSWNDGAVALAVKDIQSIFSPVGCRKILIARSQ